MPTNQELETLPIEAPELDAAFDELTLELLPIPDEATQEEIVRDALSDHLAAIQDRADWESGIATDEDQYLGNLPEKTFPYKGCSNLFVPLTMLGVETLKPRLIEAVMGSDPVVYAIPTESADEKRAQTTELFLNWQLRMDLAIATLVEESAHTFLTPGEAVAKILWRTEERRVKQIRTFAPETSLTTVFEALFPDALPEDFEADPKDSLTWTGVFKNSLTGMKRDVRVVFRVTEDAIRVLVDQEKAVYDGPRIELLNPEDFVAPFRGGWDVQRLPWVHHRLWYTEDALRRKVKQGRFYRDTVEMLIGDLPTGTEDGADQPGKEIRDVRAKSEGVPDPASSVKQDEYEVIERYCLHDMDEDGFEEEVILWFSPQLPDRLLGWDYLDNVCAHGKRPFVRGQYLRLPGRFYGLSFPRIVRDLQDEINTIHNQRVDAGTLQNTPSYFYRASMTTRPGDTQPIRPGMGIPVDNPQTDILMVNWNGNTVFGQNEEALLYQYFERLTGLTDLALGRQPNRVGATRTASGTAALLSEAGLRFKTAMESFQAFWTEVFEHVLALDQQYLAPGKEFRVTGRVPEVIRIADRTQIAGRYDLRLSATTETMNKSVLREDATAKLNTLLSSPIPLQLGLLGVKGVHRLYQQFLRAYGERDPNMVLEPVPDQAMIRTPEQELALWLSGEDARPSMLENLQAHLEAHMQQMEDPVIPDALKKLKIAPHLAETLKVAQMQAVVNQMQSSGKPEGGSSPVAGTQAMNAQIGRNAPEQPAQFGGGAKGT